MPEKPRRRLKRRSEPSSCPDADSFICWNFIVRSKMPLDMKSASFTTCGWSWSSSYSTSICSSSPRSTSCSGHTSSSSSSSSLENGAADEAATSEPRVPSGGDTPRSGGRRPSSWGVPRTRFPFPATQSAQRRHVGRFGYGPYSAPIRCFAFLSTRSKSARRRPPYRNARIVSVMTTSGCENSEARLGVSLPTKGTTRSSRLSGSVPASFASAICSAESSPYETRFTLASANGTIDCSSSRESQSIFRVSSPRRSNAPLIARAYSSGVVCQLPGYMSSVVSATAGQRRYAITSSRGHPLGPIGCCVRKRVCQSARSGLSSSS